MKYTLAACVLLICSGVACADNNKRQDCNKMAEGMSGNERNRTISACVRHNANVNSVPPMLERMRRCNDKAGNMTGPAREKFVNQCMNIQ